MKPQATKKKKKGEDKENPKPTDKELQKQLFPSLAIPNDPNIAKVSADSELDSLVNEKYRNIQIYNAHKVPTIRDALDLLPHIPGRDVVGSIGFGSPFGTTKFGDEFGDLEHIRQYAKLMEEKDRGDEEESSVESSDNKSAFSQRPTACFRTEIQTLTI